MRREMSQMPAVDLLRDSFPEQVSFVRDQSPQQSAMCPRRAAKSYSLGLKLFDRGIRYAGRKCLYIGLTRESARSIMWTDVLADIDCRFSLGVQTHETRLEMTLPNASTIRLLGLDDNEKEQAKVLGQKYQIIVIDEAASFSIDLEHMINSTLKACVADYEGEIVIAGTASNMADCFFHRVTDGRVKGWSRHAWLAEANPYTRNQIAKQIAELIANNPLVESTPWFQQMYLNRWVIDESALIYKFSPARNSFTHLPERNGYRYILGCDMGYEDDSAFVVLAYHEHDPVLYAIYAWKKKGMDLTDFATKVHELDAKYNFDVTVVDGAAKQAVAELNNRQGLRLIAADKTGKMDFVEVVMNTQLLTGRLLVHKYDARCLADEWAGLVRDPKSKKREEHPNCPNHASDAALYGARYCYSYLSTPPQAEPKRGTLEWARREAEEMERRTIERLEKEDFDKQMEEWGQAAGWN